MQYVYENAAYPYALTGIIDENNNRVASWTYDATMRAVSSQHAGGADSMSFSYNLNSLGAKRKVEAVQETSASAQRALEA